jgi:hypothetical protein
VPSRDRAELQMALLARSPRLLASTAGSDNGSQPRCLRPRCAGPQRTRVREVPLLHGSWHVAAPAATARSAASASTLAACQRRRARAGARGEGEQAGEGCARARSLPACRHALVEWFATSARWSTLPHFSTPHRLPRKNLALKGPPRAVRAYGPDRSARVRAYGPDRSARGRGGRWGAGGPGTCRAVASVNPKSQLTSYLDAPRVRQTCNRQTHTCPHPLLAALRLPAQLAPLELL